MYADTRTIQGGQLRRQVSHIAGMDTFFVHQARHLDAAPFRQIGYESFVFNIGVDPRGRPGFDRVNNRHPKLDAADDRKFVAATELLF